MSQRVEQTIVNHNKGYNCAQAVACAYADLYDVSEKDAFRATEAFGRGMGSMSTCGAVSAMVYLVGLQLSDVNLEQPRSKMACYKKITEMTDAFTEKNKSIVCRELKGIGTGEVLRSCQGCITDAAELVEKYLLSE